MTRCYLLFGSNQGDKKVLWDQACHAIHKRCGMLVETSSLYLSEPWGFEAEEWFLNALIVIETDLSPDKLMDELLDIERELGRVRHPEKEGYSSRTIDLDILYYGDQIIRTTKVTAPHPRLQFRKFALMPLCEIIPDFIHPELHLSQQQLLERCHDGTTVQQLNH